MKVLVLTAMYPTPERPGFGTFVREQVESLRSAGAEIEVMFFDGQQSLRAYVRAGIELRKKVVSSQYDVVHAHYGLVALPALMQFRCPVVVTYHGSDLLGEVGSDGRYTWTGKLKVGLCKVLGCFVSGRIIVAEMLRTRMWDATTVPMGVNTGLFQPRPRQDARRALGLTGQRKYVLFVANPANRVKRIDLAQAAVDLVAKDDPEVELLPVFNVPHEQVSVYMNAGNALILTSDHEASPCVVKEALASNLPIVSVACGDVEERLSGVSGSYVCERTPEDLAAKLRLALAFGDMSNGREAIGALSLENIAHRTLAVLEEAARGRRHP